MKNKFLNYLTITLIAVGCGTKKPDLDISSKVGVVKDKTTTTTDINVAATEEESLVHTTNFHKKFYFETAGKTWENADSSYKSDMLQYAQAPIAQLRGLKKSYFLLLAGQPIPVFKLVHNGTDATKNAILFYLQEIEQLEGHQPEVNLHFLQQAQQFFTPAQTKVLAQKMAAWSKADYNFWKSQNDVLEAQSSMTNLEKNGYDMGKTFLQAIDKIRLIAQS